MTIAPSPEMLALAKRLVGEAHAADVSRLRTPDEYERAVLRFFGPRGPELLRAGDAAVLGAIESELGNQQHYAMRRQTRHSWAEHLTASAICVAARERIAARSGMQIAAE